MCVSRYLLCGMRFECKVDCKTYLRNPKEPVMLQQNPRFVFCVSTFLTPLSYISLYLLVLFRISCKTKTTCFVIKPNQPITATQKQRPVDFRFFPSPAKQQPTTNFIFIFIFVFSHLFLFLQPLTLLTPFLTTWYINPPVVDLRLLSSRQFLTETNSLSGLERRLTDLRGEGEKLAHPSLPPTMFIRSLPRSVSRTTSIPAPALRSSPSSTATTSPIACLYARTQTQSRLSSTVAASEHAIANPTLAGIEKRWEAMPPQEQAELWMQLRDRMKVDWHEMTLQEKKAGMFEIRLHNVP
jgi:cytochrome c oxidase subunit 4